MSTNSRYEILCVVIIITVKFNTVLPQEIQNSTQISNEAPNKNNSMPQETRLYPNHRQDDYARIVDEKQKNTTVNDKPTAESMLRPQLALQIFTNPVTSSNQHGKGDSEQENESITRKLIHKNTVNHDNRHHHMRTDPNHQRFNRRLFDNILHPNNRLEPWRYETIDNLALAGQVPRDFYEDQNLIAHVQNRDSITSTGDAKLIGNQNSNPRPLINAIISVPGPILNNQQVNTVNGRQQQIKATTNNRINSIDDPTQSASTGSPEQIEPNGDIEFSVNLNGEEIVLNPVAKNKQPDRRAHNSTKDLENSDTRELAYTNDSFKHQRVDSSKTKVKNLKRQLSSEQSDDEQSDSEIALTDRSGDDDADPDSDSDSDGDADSEPNVRDKDEDNHMRMKNDIETMSNDREQQRIYHQTNSRTSDDEASEGQSSSRGDSHSGTSDSNSHEIDEKNIVPGKKSQIMKKRVKPMEQKEGYQSLTKRKTASSKRRVTVKSSREVDDNDIRSDDNRDSKTSPDASSSLTIQSDDVKRFQQLLADLKSLSLAGSLDVKTKKPNKLSNKSLNTSSASQRSRYEEGEVSNNNSPEEGISDKLSEDVQHQRHQKTQSQALNSRTTLSKPEMINNCDKLRRATRSRERSIEHEDGLSPMSELEIDQEQIEPDSSVNRDSIDELEDSIQNSESQDIIPNEVYNRHISNEGVHNLEDAIKSDIQNDEQPTTLFVRKTVLENYYDNEENPKGNKISESHPKMLEVGHDDEHKRRERSHSGASPRAVNEQREDHSRLRSRSFSLNSHRLVAERPSPLNNYIDYSQLENRGPIRAGDNQGFRVSSDRGIQANNLRSLQQVIDKAAESRVAIS